MRRRTRNRHWRREKKQSRAQYRLGLGLDPPIDEAGDPTGDVGRLQEPVVNTEQEKGSTRRSRCGGLTFDGMLEMSWLLSWCVLS